MSAPSRIQLRRTKGWRKPDGTIIVARPSRWGNPFVIGDDAIMVRASGELDGPGAGYYNPRDVRYFDVEIRAGLTAAEAVALYRDDLIGNLTDEHEHYDELRSALLDLRGHDLGCWCPLDRPCHADVLLELANAPLPEVP